MNNYLKKYQLHITSHSFSYFCVALVCSRILPLFHFELVVFALQRYNNIGANPNFSPSFFFAVLNFF